MRTRYSRSLRLEPLESRQLLAADLTNFGQIGQAWDVEDGQAVFSLPEAVQRIDFNGDGDTTDVVLHLHDAATGTTSNIGLAAAFAEVEGSRVVMLVIEAQQGGMDLNGDGDASDWVLHVYDTETAKLTNLGFAMHNLLETAITQNYLFFTVHEGNNKRVDRNGDDDTSDSVLHVYDMASGTITNLGVAATDIQLDGTRLAFSVPEYQQSNVDLNGDEDSSDLVVHVYDTLSSTMTNLGISPERWLPGSSQRYSLSGDHLAVRVSEYMQGDDLNGDDDKDDVVLHLVDLATMTTTNFEVAVDGVAINDHLLAFGVMEAGQGEEGTNLNGDGDATDTVMHVHVLGTGGTDNLQLAGNPSSSGCLFGDQLRFGVSERTQGGSDLNGDGDAHDVVLHAFDSSDGVVNHRVALQETISLSDQLVVFRAWEETIDLNGDGDVQDKVLKLYDPATATLSHLPYAVHLSQKDYRLDGDYLAFPVVEADQSSDLNGDGDMSDQVLHVHDLVLGTTSNLGMHSTNLMLGDGLLLFVTSEYFQGHTDLNGDGDAVDPILYLANLSPTPPTPAELVEQIAAGIVSLDLQSGLSNSLATKIDGAMRMLGADVGSEVSIAGKLGALIHEIEAQRDKHVSAEDADALIADLEEVLSLLEPL